MRKLPLLLFIFVVLSSSAVAQSSPEILHFDISNDKLTILAKGYGDPRQVPIPGPFIFVLNGVQLGTVGSGYNEDGNYFRGGKRFSGVDIFNTQIGLSVEDKDLLQEGTNQFILLDELTNEGLRIEFTMGQIPTGYNPRVISVDITDPGMTVTNATLRSGDPNIEGPNMLASNALVCFENCGPADLSALFPFDLPMKTKKYDIYGNDIFFSTKEITYLPEGAVDLRQDVFYWVPVPNLDYSGKNTISFKDESGKGFTINFDFTPSVETEFGLESVDYLNEFVKVPIFRASGGSIGEYVFLKGFGFPPNNKYVVYLGGQEIKGVSSDKNGLLYNAFELTSELAPLITTQNLVTLRQGDKIIVGSRFPAFKQRLGLRPGKPILVLVPPKGSYGDRIDIYGQGLEPGKAYPVNTLCFKESLSVKTDSYGKFHVSNIETDPSVMSKIIIFFKSLFSRDPTPEEIIEGTQELGKSCSIEVQFPEGGGVGTHFYIE